MRKMINNIASVLEGVTTAAIAGHVRPDGDCVGSCMGMYLYLKENYPQIQADVYLEEVPEVFHFIQDIDKAKQEWEDKAYDLFLGFDVSSIDRIGVAGRALETAKMTGVHRSSHHKQRTCCRRIRSFRMQVLPVKCSMSCWSRKRSTKPVRKHCIPELFMIPVCSSTAAPEPERWRLPDS